MKYKDQLASFGSDVILQALFEKNKMPAKTFEGSPAMGQEMSKCILSEAKKRGIPEPKWNGVAWVIPED